jgi:tetratricopeptide (TPR) repeat protein
LRHLPSPRVLTATLGLTVMIIGSGCSSLRHKNSDELWAESDQHFNEGRYDEAKPYYDELIRRDDVDTKARLMRGVARERTGEESGALEDYEVASGRGDVRALFFRADLNIRRGEYSTAERDLAALRDMGLGGRDTVVHLTLLGTLRLKQKQWLFAAQNLERACQAGSSYGDAGLRRHVRTAHYNAGQAYYQLGDFGRAYDHMLAFAGGSPNAPTDTTYPLSGEESYLLGLLAYLAGDFNAADHHLANADPDMVARAADVLDDPSFGAGGHREPK